jgi:hypothetical protein
VLLCRFPYDRSGRTVVQAGGGRGVDKSEKKLLVAATALVARGLLEEQPVNTERRDPVFVYRCTEQGERLRRLIENTLRR